MCVGILPVCVNVHFVQEVPITGKKRVLNFLELEL